MSFAWGYRPSAVPRTKSLRSPVLPVGGRFLVSSPSNPPGTAILTDRLGTTTLATLADGVQVEITAWQPHWTDGTRYRVRSASGVDGWLGAINLKPRAADVHREVPAPAAERPRR